MSIEKFEDFGLSLELTQAINDLGFSHPTPIQAQAIPVILEGQDVTGQAQTGTGKTAAFGIPCIEKIDEFIPAIQGVVLCPTRELAMQISNEFKKFAKYKVGIQTLAVYGGQDINIQIKALRQKPQIIIATPGRIIDLWKRKQLNFDSLKTIILDEADEMFDMGFRSDIEFLLGKCPENRQTLLFSATLSKEILAISENFQTNPQIVKTEVKKTKGAPQIEQFYFKVDEKSKLKTLTNLMDFHQFQKVLIFSNTKRRVDSLMKTLHRMDYKVDGLHGDMKQQQRSFVMDKFRSGKSQILIASDVVARGIDVEDVEAVINFDIPQDLESYLHRIGRTGRAGKKGMAYSFVTRVDMGKIKALERYTKTEILAAKPPSDHEVEAVRTEKLADLISKQMEKSADKINTYASKLDLLQQNTGLDTHQLSMVLLRMLDKKEAQFDEVKLPDGKMFEGSSPKSGSRKGGRRDRDRGGRGKPKRVEKGMVKFFLNVGKNERISPGDIVGSIAGEAGIPGRSIGAITIFDKFSFVEVPEQYAENVLSSMDNNTVKGKKVNIEPANA